MSILCRMGFHTWERWKETERHALKRKALTQRIPAGHYYVAPAPVQGTQKPDIVVGFTVTQERVCRACGFKEVSMSSHEIE